MKRQEWMGEPMMMEWLEERRMMSAAALSQAAITDGTSNTIMVGEAQPRTSTAVTGRITGIAVDPSDPSGNTMYVGSANGGIWKTTN